MFGLEFSFGSMIWALPLAALPVVLHLLYRRKSPVIPFSTLRFIKSAIQHTAARRRVQRWVLLACRVLLLALLIVAIAQPVKSLASNWMAASKSTVAAIVIDTSYSMMLEDQDAAILTRADEIAQDLLRGILRDSKVAVLTSRAPAGAAIEMESATKLLSEWRPLKPEPALLPLSARVLAAQELLSRQQADHRWLVVISDLQNREFPAPLPPLSGEGDWRTILFDLHPDEARSAGATAVRLEPAQPLPGVGTVVAVEVTGRAGDARAVTLGIASLAGAPLNNKPTLMANVDAAGRTNVRFDLRTGVPVPMGPDQKPQRFLRLDAVLQADDAMAWDNSRTQLVEIPPPQQVTLVAAPSHPAAERFLRLAMDPWEGKATAWPLVVRRAPDLSGAEQVGVVMLSAWPDEQRARRLADFAKAGGTLILFLQPGLEESWAALPPAQKQAMLELLPSQPMAGERPPGAYRAAPASEDPLMQGLTENSLQVGQIVVRRFVPLLKSESADVATVLSMSAATPSVGSRLFGLIHRKTVGRGMAYTVPTLPDSLYTSLPLHPLFMPIMVRMSLPSAGRSDAQNVELGQPLSLSLAGKGLASPAGVQLIDPAGAVYQFDPGRYREGDPFLWDQAEKRMVYPRTEAPGTYLWRKDGGAVLAVGNVQLPAAESELQYRAADAVVAPGQNTIVARSLEEFAGAMSRASEPEPRWTPFVMMVILLLCAEALLGSVSHLWKGREGRTQGSEVAGQSSGLGIQAAGARA